MKSTCLVALLTLSFATVASSEDECGKERWSQKTATDGAPYVEADPPETWTVEQLLALEAPRYKEGRAREGVELKVVRVVAYLRKVKLEPDGDVHIVISGAADSPDGQTMVVEFPNPDCAKNSPFRDRMSAARQALVGVLGAVYGRNFRTLSTPARVELVGIIFFDKRHGATGAAPNGVELHPVVGLKKT